MVQGCVITRLAMQHLLKTLQIPMLPMQFVCYSLGKMSSALIQLLSNFVVLNLSIVVID